MTGHRSWTSNTDSESGTSCPGDPAASRVVRDEHTNRRARPDSAPFVAENSLPQPTYLATPQNSILHVGLVKTHGGRCLPSALEFAPVQVDNVVFHFPLPPSSNASSTSLSEIAPVDSVSDFKISLDDHKSLVTVVTTTELETPDYATHDPFDEEVERGRQMSTTPGLSRRAIARPKSIENPCPCNRDRSSSIKRPGPKAGRESLQQLRERLDLIVPELEDGPIEEVEEVEQVEKVEAARPRQIGVRQKSSKHSIQTISYPSLSSTGPEKIISYQSVCPSGEPIDHIPPKKPNVPNSYQRQRLEPLDPMRNLPIAAEFKRRDSEIELLFGRGPQHHKRTSSKPGPHRSTSSRSSKAHRILGQNLSAIDLPTISRPTTSSASKPDRLLGEANTILASRSGLPNIPSRSPTLGNPSTSSDDANSLFSAGRKRALSSAAKQVSGHVRRISANDAQTLWKPSDLWKPNARVERAATVASRTSVTVKSTALAKKLGVPIGGDLDLGRGNCSSHDLGSFARHSDEKDFDHNNDDEGDLYAILPDLDRAFSWNSGSVGSGSGSGSGSLSEKNAVLMRRENRVRNLRKVGLVWDNNSKDEY